MTDTTYPECMKYCEEYFSLWESHSALDYRWIIKYSENKFNVSKYFMNAKSDTIALSEEKLEKKELSYETNYYGKLLSPHFSKWFNDDKSGNRERSIVITCKHPVDIPIWGFRGGFSEIITDINKRIVQCNKRVYTKN
jgi:hypothetical protein